MCEGAVEILSLGGGGLTGNAFMFINIPIPILFLVPNIFDTDTGNFFGTKSQS